MDLLPGTTLLSHYLPSLHTDYTYVQLHSPHPPVLVIAHPVPPCTT